MSDLKLMAPLLSLLEALSFVNTGDGKTKSSNKRTRAFLFAFRKWNSLAAAVSSFHNECVLIILVLCDSPHVASDPRLACGLDRHLTYPNISKSTTEIWGTFLGLFLVTSLVLHIDLSGYPASGLFIHSTLIVMLTEGTWLGRVFVTFTWPWHILSRFSQCRIACHAVLVEVIAWKNAAKWHSALLQQIRVWHISWISCLCCFHTFTLCK